MSAQQGPHGNITEQELKNIRRTIQGRALLNAVSNIVYQRQFSVGDTLVVRYVSGNNNGKLMEETAGVPERYQVIHKDEADLVYVKKILKGGKLGQKVDMIATWDYDRHRFEPDPEKMESILMDQEEGFDPFAKAKELKKRQDRQRRANQKIRLRFKDQVEAEKYIRTLKVGEVLFSSHSLIDDTPNEREIVSIDLKPLEQPKQSWGSTYDPDAAWRNAGYTDKCILTVKYKDPRYKSTSTIDSSELCRTWTNFYNKKPFTSEEV